MSDISPFPLADVRIVSVEQYGAGPWATLQLADLGAQIIKLEDPSSGGDVGRYVPPFQRGEDSLFFEAFNRGKQSVSLDLKDSAGQQAFRDLVTVSDGVFCNLRGDLPARLGLTYDALRDVNPRVVCCSLSGFGMTGPRADQAAYDYVIQGMTGWMSITGGPDEPPTKSGLSLVDFCGGLVASTSMLAGLLQARRTGEGCDCDVSLFETALAQTNYLATWVSTEGFEPQRHADSAHPSVVPFQLFRTADGSIVVACAKEKFWLRFCEAIGRPDLRDDPAFSGFADRQRNREALVSELGKTIGERTTGEWLETLVPAGVPCGPVNSIAEALADPQVIARNGVVSAEHPRLGTVHHVAPAVRAGGSRVPVRPAPERGEHTAMLLRTLCGYSDEQVRAVQVSARTPLASA